MTIKVPLKYRYSRTQRWSFLNWVDIESKSNPGYVYLRRLRIFQTPWFAFYLHFIYESDADRYPHDHPWEFWSFILRGSYCEDVYSSVNGVPESLVWNTFSFHGMPQDKAHKITYASEDLVTFVFTGRRRSSWNFWTLDGLVDWKVLELDEGELA